MIIQHGLLTTSPELQATGSDYWRLCTPRATQCEASCIVSDRAARQGEPRATDFFNHFHELDNMHWYDAVGLIVRPKAWNSGDGTSKANVLADSSSWFFRVGTLLRCSTSSKLGHETCLFLLPRDDITTVMRLKQKRSLSAWIISHRRYLS